MVEKYVANHKLSYPVAAGFKAERKYTITGYPNVSLVSHEGKVLWQGLPWDLKPSVIDDAIAEAKADLPWEKSERHACLAKAQKLAMSGKLGSAWKAAEGARKKVEGDTAALNAIDGFLQDILNRGTTRLAKANRIAESGRYFVAVEFLTQQGVMYKGTPSEKEWKAVTKGWLKDKQIKQQYDFDKKRLSALKAAYGGDGSKSFKTLKKLAQKAEGLPIAAAILKDMEGVRTM